LPFDVKADFTVDGNALESILSEPVPTAALRSIAELVLM